MSLPSSALTYHALTAAALERAQAIGHNSAMTRDQAIAALRLHEQALRQAGVASLSFSDRSTATPLSQALTLTWRCD